MIKSCDGSYQIKDLHIHRVMLHIDGLVHEIRNYIAIALDLRLSCTNRSMLLHPKYVISLQFLYFLSLESDNIYWLLWRKCTDRQHGRAKYRHTSNTRRTKSHHLFCLATSCSCFSTDHWSQVLGRWKCSWNSADRRCYIHIWVINNCHCLLKCDL